MAFLVGCVRDECTYLRLSERILNGEGMTASNGWIWAPGYPFILALHEGLTGYGAGIKTTQAIASVCVMALFISGVSVLPIRQVGKIAVWMYALSPTQIFFAQSLWSECLYGGLLLLGVWVFDKARKLRCDSESDETCRFDRSVGWNMRSLSRCGDVHVADILRSVDLATLGYESSLDAECRIGSCYDLDGRSIFDVCLKEVWFIHDFRSNARSDDVAGKQ